MPPGKCSAPKFGTPKLGIRSTALVLLLLLTAGMAGASPVYFIGLSDNGRNRFESLFLINPVTGTPVQIGAITGDRKDMGMEGLAFSSSLGLFGAEDGTLYSINSAN